jgi:glutathione synthase
MTEFWFFDTEKDLEKIRSMVQEPEDYVLKTPREGGGTCFFGEEMVKKVTEGSVQDLKHLVLMKFIKMSPSISYVMRQYELEVAATNSEIGQLSCLMTDDKTVLAEKSLGSMVKTKKTTDKEGGITMAGGAVDAFILV